MQANGSSTTWFALKIFLAVLAGAVMPALIVTVISWRAAAVQAPESGLGQRLTNATIVFLFALAFTAAHAFILGLPAVLLGIKLRAIRWWSCILVSFLIGFIPVAWAFGSDFLGSLHAGGLGGGLGSIGGLTFWLVWHFWVPHTPSRGAGLPTGPVEIPTAADGG